jgi:tRNA G18 (ribose-2'-O)-methylase SpoU
MLLLLWQGVVLDASPASYTAVDSAAALVSIVDKLRGAAADSASQLPPPPLVLALDEVWDPHNVGAMLRTCHFLGCDAVLVRARTRAGGRLRGARARLRRVEQRTCFIITLCPPPLPRR